MSIIAVTGDTGAGKTSFVNYFKTAVSFNLCTIHADTIAKLLWHKPKIKDVAVERWGKYILQPDLSIDKNKIAKIIFDEENDSEYEFMKRLIYPEVSEEIKKSIDTTSNYIYIIENALHFEALTDIDVKADLIIYITASEPVRLGRVWSNRGWSVEDLERRERHQIDSEYKKSISDLVIYNNYESIQEFHDKIDRIIRIFRLNQKSLTNL